MLITDVSQIDSNKLSRLLKERGHGVINDSFWIKLEDALNNNFLEVHQCSCGELLFIDKVSPYPKDKDGNVLCKNCGKFENITVSYKEINIIDNLVEKTRLYIETSNQTEKKLIFEQIKDIGGKWFPTSSFQEFHYALNMHQYYLTEHSENFLNLLEIIKDLCEKAKTSNENYYKEIFGYIDIISMNSKLKSFWVENEDLEKKFNIKANSNLNVTGLEANYDDQTFIEEIVRKYITLYRLLIENTEPLKFLANLSLVLNNNSPLPNPIPKKIRGSLASTIEHVLKLSNLNNVKNLIENGYNNKLRNDDAHNQYTVLLEEKKVYSRKYDVFYTFNEILEKYNQLYDFHEVFNHIIELYYDNKLFPGIKDVKFQIDLESTESLLIIYQFVYFNFENQLPKIKVKLIKNQSILEFYYGEFIISHLIGKNNFNWYVIPILTQIFTIKVIIIMPKLGYYAPFSKGEIELGNNIFYIKSEKTKKIRLTKEFTEKIRDLINNNGYSQVNEE